VTVYVNFGGFLVGCAVSVCFSARARGGRGGVVVAVTFSRFWVCFPVQWLFLGSLAATTVDLCPLPGSRLNARRLSAAYGTGSWTGLERSWRTLSGAMCIWRNGCASKLFNGFRGEVTLADACAIDKFGGALAGIRTRDRSGDSRAY
jgi:hypothetical protein